MNNADAANETLEKKEKRKDKVRSAWISFAGRIVAQIVGAIATVALGVMVLHRYTSLDAPPPVIASVPGHPNVAATLGTLPAALGATGMAPIVIVMAAGTCTPALDTPAASAARFDERSFLPR